MGTTSCMCVCPDIWGLSVKDGSSAVFSLLPSSASTLGRRVGSVEQGTTSLFPFCKAL
jgi:hypothetical protein